MYNVCIVYSWIGTNSSSSYRYKSHFTAISMSVCLKALVALVPKKCELGEVFISKKGPTTPLQGGQERKSKQMKIDENKMKNAGKATTATVPGAEDSSLTDKSGFEILPPKSSVVIFESQD